MFVISKENLLHVKFTADIIKNSKPERLVF